MEDLSLFSSLAIIPFLALGIQELGHLISALYFGFRLELLEKMENTKAILMQNKHHAPRGFWKSLQID